MWGGFFFSKSGSLVSEEWWFGFTTTKWALLITSFNSYITLLILQLFHSIVIVFFYCHMRVKKKRQDICKCWLFETVILWKRLSIHCWNLTKPHSFRSEMKVLLLFSMWVLSPVILSDNVNLVNHAALKYNLSNTLALDSRNKRTFDFSSPYLLILDHHIFTI